MRIVDEVMNLLAGPGREAYLGEQVSQAEHALQAAWLAERDGAPDSLVISALLHDVGHLVLGALEDVAHRGIDAHHEDAGAAWLDKHFGPEVTGPARLHVAAKRYLCTVESDYFGKLAPDSVRSLKLQGGLMSPDEVETFRRHPQQAEAVRLRRYDEAAKDPQAATPDFDHFLRHVEACRIQ